MGTPNLELSHAEACTDTRVLIVEDNPQDALLIQATLEHSGDHLTCEIVDTLDLFRRKLGQGGFEIIISDFNLGNWTALDALEEVRKSGKEIPLVVVSGSLGDEAAADCIKLGARDYILKDRLARLPMAIKHALAEKRLRDEHRWMVRVQEATYRTSQAATSARDLAELFQSIHQIVGELIPADNFFIALYDAETDLLSFPYFVDEHDSPPPSHTPGKGLTEYVLKTGEALLATPELFARLVSEGKVVSMGTPSVDWLGVPLGVGGTNLGVLAVQTYSEARRYGEDDKRILAFVSSQIAITIQRKRAEQKHVESEERYRSVVAALAEGIVVQDKNGKIIACNPSAERILGLTIDQLGGRTSMDPRWRSIHEDGTPFPGDAHPAMVTLRTGEPQADVPMGVQKPDGSLTWISVNSQPIWGSDKSTPQAVVSSFADITARKSAEEALRRSEAELKEAQRIAHVGSWSRDLRTGESKWSDEVFRIVGLDPSAPPPSADEQNALFTPENKERVAAAAQHVQQTGNPYILDTEIVRPDGGHRWLTIRGEAVREISGQVVALRGTVQDITERKEGEQLLLQSEENYRTLFDSIDEGFCTIEVLFDEHDKPVDYRFLEVNPSFEKQTGIQNARGRSMREIAPHHEEHWFEIYGNIALTGKPARFDSPAAELHRWYDVYAFRVGDPRLRRVAILFNDISNRKRAEEALVKLKKAVDTSSEVIFMTDREGIITFVNAEFTRLYGYAEAEVVGKVTPRILKSGSVDPAEYVKFWTTILNKGVARLGIVNRTKDGRMVNIEASANPILDDRGEIAGFLAIQRDMTQHMKLEQQFRQAQKMEAVGQLAGGVAHDFNNLLTVINGYSEVLQERMKPDDPFQKYVNEIKKAGGRAAGLTRQLLAFSRQQVLAPQVLDLNHVISGVHSMLRRIIGEDIDLAVAPGKGLGLVKADPGQIEQVLLNLAVNSRDAMPHGGKLTIETANVDFNRSSSEEDSFMTTGAYILLTVSDNGTGMDAETQKRIFEPFFTTKEKGKGTGLGLSTVYGIVKQSGGYIWVYSELGHGTTFKVYLPRIDAAISSTEPSKTQKEIPGGTETVLLVEDDDSIRRLGRESLGARGYHVLEAAQGDEAIALAQQHQGAIQLLITDMVMPGMNGRILAEHMEASRPEMKVLYISGYTDDVVVRHGGVGPGMPFLQKPFTPEDLARKVRAVLDGN